MFHFKKQAKVYLVFNGNKYQLDTSMVEFSQTFTEEEYSQKTIQEEKMFWESSLYKAQPIKWNLSIPLISEQDMRILFDSVVNPRFIDLYVETKTSTFKLEKCVPTNGIFVIARNMPLRMEVSGEGSKVTKVTEIPGTVISRASKRTYAKISVLEVELGGVSNLTSFTEFTAEIQNNIKWIPYNTLNTALTSVDKNTIAYPQEYVIDKRIFAGTFTRYYIAGETKNPNTTLYVRAGDLDNGKFFGVSFDLENVSYTARVGTNSVFTESFDWRLTQNPQSLSELVQYYTEYELGDVVLPGYILDNNLEPILDNNGQPLVESI